jgi:flagellar protein FliO/FliZ
VSGVGPDIALPLWRMLAALAVVLAILGGLGWVMRRGVVARRKIGTMAVESALTLGDRRSLVVLSVEGRRLLLGLAPGQISMVAELQPRQTFDEALTRAAATPRSAAS